ncbi:hypothetical protein CVE24_03365 [Pseudomonas syringae pv. actinidiae]|nr:hypothetical protein [Pseudomonas syringae pv. actinidiae]
MGCEAALKQAVLVVPDTPYALVLLPVPGRSWTSPLLRPPGRSVLRVRTGRRLVFPIYLGFCGSELARELPGTGSKTGAHGTSGATEVAGFQGVSQPNIQPRR